MNRGSYGASRPSPPSLPFVPGGYLTLVSGSPVITSDQASKTVVYYTPDTHNAFPIIKNGEYHAVYFAEPRLVLSSAHSANGIFDVFGVETNGEAHIVTGPNWTAGTSGSVTAGSCARGTGPGSTELTRIGGMQVNRWGLTGLNDNGPTYVPPLTGVYLGSIFMDGSSGQVTCHRSYGKSRKWGLWNNYGRRPLVLKAGDSGGFTDTYGSATIRPANNDSTISLTTFSGLETAFDANLTQTLGTGGGACSVGIGINSTTAYSGMRGSCNNLGGTSVLTLLGAYVSAPLLGINTVTSLESGNASNPVFNGGESNHLLRARWDG